MPVRTAYWFMVTDGSINTAVPIDTCSRKCSRLMKQKDVRAVWPEGAKLRATGREEEAVVLRLRELRRAAAHRRGRLDRFGKSIFDRKAPIEKYRFGFSIFDRKVYILYT